jgi:serine/threonine protein kinase
MEDSVEKKLEQYNYKLTELLGTGSYGSAYKLSNGNVMKITGDKTEARSASYIKGKHLKHVYEVYDVFQFKTLPYKWFIETELLTPLSDSETQKLEGSAIAGEDTRSIKYWFNQLDKLKENYGEIPKIAMDIAYGLLELNKLGIEFGDTHAGNIMKRHNGDYVIIDIGQSRSPEGQIKVLEQYYKRFKFL